MSWNNINFDNKKTETSNFYKNKKYLIYMVLMLIKFGL